MRTSQFCKSLGALLLVVGSCLLPTWSKAQTTATADLERLAEGRFEEDDLAGAIALYRQLADRLPAATEKVRVWMTIAWIEHLSNYDRGATETLAKALELLPETPFRAELYSDGFRDLFIEARQLAENRRQRSGNQQINQALEKIRQREWPAARQLLLSALDTLPNQPTALYNLALVDLYQEHAEAAMAGFQKVLALAAAQPESVSPQTRALALTNLGFLFNSRQLYAEAEDALAQAVELDPGNASAWTNLGVTRRRLGRKQEAAAAFRRAYDALPNDPSVLNNLALAYLDAEDWTAAVGLLLEATGKYPDNAGLWLNLGIAQRGLGNPRGAVEALETVFRQDPRNAAGFAISAAIQLARYYYDQGQYTDSARQAQRAIDWQPSLVDPWLYLGLCQQALGEIESAAASFQQAIAQDPTRAEAHNNLGSLHASRGEYSLARQSFERALSIQPDFEDARRNLQAVERRGAGTSPTLRSPSPSSRPTTGRKPAAAGTQPTTLAPPNGSTKGVPALLGLRFSPIDYGSFGLSGTLIQTVEPASSGERAGLRVNDLVLRVDGRTVSDADQLRAYIARQVPGATLELVILRSNLPQRLSLSTR